jgi:2-oxoisovalerate dehydrogenase E1 component
MPVYRDAAHLYQVMQALFERIQQDPEVVDALAGAGIVLRFHLREPEATVTFDLTRRPPVMETGKSALLPDVQMWLPADVNHLFWLGRLNVPRAFATRQIVARGSIPKALALLPAVRPVFQVYPEVLHELGYADMLPVEVPTPRQFDLWQILARVRDLLPRISPPAVDYAALADRRIPLVVGEVPELAQGDHGGSPLRRRGGASVPAHEADETTLKCAMLRQMIEIRAFETVVQREFAAGRIPAETVFISTGQEASAVGACFALRPTDYLATTYRCLGHVLAKGADPNQVMAELFGKETGLCHGRGGQMHLADASIGLLGANGIVGASTLMCVGAALSAKLRQTDHVALCFLGDGATNHGMFHESLNFAAVFDLPAVFVIENNQYGEFTPLEKHTRLRQLSQRAAAYGMPGVTVDGNDAWAVYSAVREAVSQARSGGGPTLIECMTYRWRGHSEADPTEVRDPAEIEAWKARDPIVRLTRELQVAGAIDDTTLATMTAGGETKAEAALRFAVDSPEPARDTAAERVFAPEPAVLFGRGTPPPPPGTRTVTTATAINEALAEEMARDERVIVIGEDIGPGGYFGVTAGLKERFGEHRLIDTPISEYALVGGAMAAAMTGLRPVVEIQFSDFLTCAMDPIVNQIAKMHLVSGGQYRVPLVIRTPAGAGISMGAQHSQSFEALLTGIPGLMVVAPGTPLDCKGLLKAAIRSNNPVLFFENKLLYAASGPVPDRDYVIPIGVAEVKRIGRDVTIVALGAMIGPALEAAEQVAADGIDAEVVDLRTLVPADWPTAVRSVVKTGRLVVAEEGHLTHGFGAEVAARVSEAAVGALRAPIRRVAALDCPIPYNRSLENVIVPGTEAIAAAIRAVVGRG